MKKILLLLGLGYLILKPKQTTANTNSQSQNQSTFNGNQSYLGTNNPRGIRNNNPGNLKISSSAWQGKIPEAQNTDGTFEQFQEYKYGVRAMTKLLINYINSGRNSIESILNSYSSGSDAYKNYVSNRTGYTRNQILTADKEILRKLVQAMAYFENGVEAVNDATFNQAYTMI